MEERDDWSITVAWLCLAALSALIACRMLWLYTPLWEWLGEEDIGSLHSADVHDSVRYVAIALAVALCVAICIAGARNASSQKTSEEEEEVFEDAHEGDAPAASRFWREPQPYGQPPRETQRPQKPTAASAQSSEPEQSTLTPRSAARAAIGTRLSSEQAVKAADKIVTLRCYVSGQRSASLDDIWGFFDMAQPSRDRMWFSASDPTIQSLKGKLNRQRLLLHPDKNSHPEAEKTFKFLEQCHQRLCSAFVRDDASQRESVHQRTRREEEELRQERERRQQQEEERRQFEEQRAREEEEKLRKQEEEAKRAELEKERLTWMVQAKQASETERLERMGRRGQPQSLIETLSMSCRGGNVHADEHDVPGVHSLQQDHIQDASAGSAAPIGILKVQLIGAKDLPQQPWLVATNAYALARVGRPGRTLSSRTPPQPGCSPTWNSSFQIPVHKQDTSLHIAVWREGLGGLWLSQDFLLGSVEIPLLDLEEWSNIVIGRVLEPASTEWSGAAVSTMVVELRAHFEWQ